MVTYFLLLFLFLFLAEEFAFFFAGVRCAGVFGLDGLALNMRARNVRISPLLKRRRAVVRFAVVRFALAFLRAGRAGACGVLVRMRDDAFTGVL